MLSYVGIIMMRWSLGVKSNKEIKILFSKTSSQPAPEAPTAVAAGKMDDGIKNNCDRCQPSGHDWASQHPGMQQPEWAADISYYRRTNIFVAL